MTSDLVILVPVLRRPHRVWPTITSARAATPDARLLFIPDHVDGGERKTIRAAGAEELPVTGNYATKINAATVVTTEPWLFCGADDLAFHDGWFEAALAAHAATGALVIGTRDLCNRRTCGAPGCDHSTHTLVHRSYVDRGQIDGEPGLLCEQFPHEYVDDELIAVAKFRNTYTHAPDAVVEHLHPSAGKAPLDELYRAQRARMRVGRRIFRQRQHLWDELRAS